MGTVKSKNAKTKIYILRLLFKSKAKKSKKKTVIHWQGKTKARG